MPSTPHEYFQRLDERRQLLADMMAAWEEAGIDVAICPVYALPAPLHGTTSDLLEAGLLRIRRESPRPARRDCPRHQGPT
jgi:hypothetical protein